MNPAITFLLMITLTTSLSWASEPDPDRSGTQKLKASDAITLSIQETREIKSFVGLLPELKIPQTAQEDPDLKTCVGQLVYDLNAMESTLRQMMQREGTKMSAEVNSLKKHMAHGLTLSKSCYRLFHNLDEIVPAMLTGKLNGLSMGVNAVFRLLEG